MTNAAGSQTSTGILLIGCNYTIMGGWCDWKIDGLGDWEILTQRRRGAECAEGMAV